MPRLRVREIVETFGVTDIVNITQFGGYLSHAQVLSSIGLFGEQVLPASSQVPSPRGRPERREAGRRDPSRHASPALARWSGGGVSLSARRRSAADRSGSRISCRPDGQRSTRGTNSVQTRLIVAVLGRAAVGCARCNPGTVRCVPAEPFAAESRPARAAQPGEPCAPPRRAPPRPRKLLSTEDGRWPMGSAARRRRHCRGRGQPDAGAAHLGGVERAPPLRADLHYARIAGLEIMFIVPFLLPLKAATDAPGPSARRGAVLAKRQLVCLYYGSPQEESATGTYLGQVRDLEILWRVGSGCASGRARWRR